MALEKAGELGDPVGRKPRKAFTTFGLSMLVSVIIIAWVLFILYSL